jgi:hypothetical protein
MAPRAAADPSIEVSVTVSRLACFDQLPDKLRRLGFDDVSFFYRRREPLGSTSVLYGDSELASMDREEILAAPNAIDRLRRRFPLANPRASLAEVARYVRMPIRSMYRWLQVFLSHWDLDIWRCEA